MYINTTFFILYFFFFQAEDGIRDSSVTGVQTCALPISKQEGTFPKHNKVVVATSEPSDLQTAPDCKVLCEFPRTSHLNRNSLIVRIGCFSQKYADSSESRSLRNKLVRTVSSASKTDTNCI